MRSRIPGLAAFLLALAAGCGGGGGGGATTRKAFVLPHVLEKSGLVAQVAAGDVTGDGVPDLLVHDVSESSVTLWGSVRVRESPSSPSTGSLRESPTLPSRPGRGGEAYQVLQHAFVWDSAADLCVADVDGDGAPDLVVAGGAAAQVGVWRCDPVGRSEFLSPVLLDTTVHCDRVAVADVDGDGRLDLVTLDETAGQVKVFRQTSSSPLSFTVDADPPSVGACQGLVACDLDRDGRMDLVTNRYGADAVTVFQQGAAGWAPRDFPSGLPTGRAMAVGDVDGDGWLDCVMVSEDGKSLVCLHQRPDQPGTFDETDSPLGIAVDEQGVHATQMASFGGTEQEGKAVGESGLKRVCRSIPENSVERACDNVIDEPGLALADLDRDGVLDVVAAPAPGDPDGSPLVFFGIRESPTRFGPGAERAKGVIANPGQGGRMACCVADLDGDGHVDLAVGDPDFDLLALLYFQNGDIPDEQDFTLRLRESPTLRSKGLVTADFDRDGRLDVATATDSGIEIRYQDDQGGFTGPVTRYLGLPCDGVAAGDVNGDGILDLVSQSGPMLLVSLGNPASPRSMVDLPPQPVFPTPAVGRALALADLDGDGALDCVALRESPSKASLGRGQRTGFFDVFTEIDVAVSSPRGVAVADLDGDGRPDLAVCGDGTDGSSVVLQMPGAPFKWMAPEMLSLARGVRVAAGDVNGDGRCDVVVCGALGCVVCVQSPEERGRFLPSAALSTEECGGLALADVDRDGRLDACFVETKTGTLRAITGDPDFDLRVLSLNGLPPGEPVLGVRVSTGDVNGDGKDEIFVACPSAPGAADGAIFVFGR